MQWEFVIWVLGIGHLGIDNLVFCKVEHFDIECPQIHHCSVITHALLTRALQAWWLRPRDNVQFVTCKLFSNVLNFYNSLQTDNSLVTLLLVKVTNPLPSWMKHILIQLYLVCLLLYRRSGNFRVKNNLRFKFSSFHRHRRKYLTAKIPDLR